jgi:putative transposase
VEILKPATSFLAKETRWTSTRSSRRRSRSSATPERACGLLEVSRAAFYTDRASVRSARQVAAAQLTEHIRQAHQASKGRYGARRIHAPLAREGPARPHADRPAAARRRAARAYLAPLRAHHHPDPAAAQRADLIRREFDVDAAAVNTRWCGDITYLPTWEGW